MAGATRLSSPGPLSTSPFQHCSHHMLPSVPPWEKEKSSLLVENINAKGVMTTVEKFLDLTGFQTYI